MCVLSMASRPSPLSIVSRCRIRERLRRLRRRLEPLQLAPYARIYGSRYETNRRPPERFQPRQEPLLRQCLSAKAPSSSPFYTDDERQVVGGAQHVVRQRGDRGQLTLTITLCGLSQGGVQRRGKMWPTQFRSNALTRISLAVSAPQSLVRRWMQTSPIKLRAAATGGECPLTSRRMSDGLRARRDARQCPASAPPRSGMLRRQ